MGEGEQEPVKSEENKQEESQSEESKPEEKPAEVPIVEKPVEPTITDKKLDTIKKILELGESGGTVKPELGHGVEIVDNNPAEQQTAPENPEAGGEAKPTGKFNQIFEKLKSKSTLITVIFVILLIVFIGFRFNAAVSGNAVVEDKVIEEKKAVDHIEEDTEEEPEEKGTLNDFLNKRFSGSGTPEHVKTAEIEYAYEPKIIESEEEPEEVEASEEGSHKDEKKHTKETRVQEDSGTRSDLVDYIKGKFLSIWSND